MKFLRRTWSRYSKLGKGRKKLQKWRRPTGRDNKMREGKKGHPKTVSIGYKRENKLKEKNKELRIIVRNINDLKHAKKKNEIIIGHVGKKKKIEIAKKAKEMELKIKNFKLEKEPESKEDINKK
jgi:large subunit ribosomal protein L32e|tara:strand:+ start:1230 stop:1601 length:372 start_codon:yes stop_codon:yes gene_type:complete